MPALLDDASIRELRDMLAWYKANKSNLSQVQRARPRLLGLNQLSIYFGKPTGAFSSGTTITLDPCDIHGTDNGLANVTVYVQPSQESYSMTNSTTIPITCICPYIRGDDGAYYLLGNPVEIVTDVDVDGTNRLITKKTRNAWILTVGDESAAITVHTGDACT